MAAKEPRVCPACGTRNKPTWSICAGCGETLPDGVAQPARVAPQFHDKSESRFSAASIALVLVVVVAGYFAYRSLSSSKPGASAAVATAPAAGAAPRAAGAAAPAQGAAPDASTYLRGSGLLAAGDAVGAVPLLAQAVSEQPGNARVRYSYASALYLAGSREEAVGHYQTAAQLAPQTTVYRADLARALHAQGRTEDAVVEFEAAVAISPRDQTLLREFAQALNAVGQTERATAILKRVANEDGNLTAQRQLAQSLERSGDLQGAEQGYRGVLDALPLEHISRGRLAEVLMRQERADEAIALLQDGISLDPAAAILQRNLGSILERAGNLREAAAAYREYARLAPSEPDSTDIERRAAALEARVQQAEGAQ